MIAAMIVLIVINLILTRFPYNAMYMNVDYDNTAFYLSMPFAMWGGLFTVLGVPMVGMLFDESSSEQLDGLYVVISSTVALVLHQLMVFISQRRA
jgi:hypothetical protein